MAKSMAKTSKHKTKQSTKAGLIAPVDNNINDDGAEDEDSENSISKSQKKRDSTALQAIGEELIALTPEVLRKLTLPEELLEAVLDAKRIPVSKYGGQRRQVQYIGRLMREIDAAPIVEQMHAQKAPSKHQTALHHLSERWRDRILADATAIAAFVNEFDEADAATLEKYREAAKEEQAKAKPPKHFRLLYQTIHKQVVSASEAAVKGSTKAPRT
jgi:ribosome-associated protein